MHSIKLLFVISVLTLSSFATTHNADAVIGTWLTGSKEGKVTIFRSGEYFYGKISWLRMPNTADGKPKTDANNPDPKLKSRPLMGLLNLKGLEYDAKSGTWINGEVYDPKSGKTYSCKITITDANTLEVRGYIGVSLIGRTDVWTRSE